MAYIVIANKVMANKVMAYIVMAYVIMAYIVMAYIVMAYIVMAYIGMASPLSSPLVSMEHACRHTGTCDTSTDDCSHASQVCRPHLSFRSSI